MKEEMRSIQFGLGKGDLYLAAEQSLVVHLRDGVEAVLDVLELHQRHTAVVTAPDYLYALHHPELLENVF
jgi:hypothetical protein